jgi:hypothetical protein
MTTTLQQTEEEPAARWFRMGRALLLLGAATVGIAAHSAASRAPIQSFRRGCSNGMRGVRRISASGDRAAAKERGSVCCRSARCR